MATIYEEIKIASKADTRGFKKAESAAAKLNKTLKNLGLALGTTALVSYGKAAVKAFAADEAAANRLATAVDNLGLSFSQVQVATFIDNLERSAAIADDVLRPAFQGLLTTTGSLTQSQKLLNDAIQISRASGIDLATVATDLGKGYVGITRGLVKYNTGLTRAEITTKSFNEILGIMLARSAGSAQAYLETTSYKMEVLSTATGRAQETIGKGLVDALARVGGGTEASDAAKAIDDIAKATSNVIVALGAAIGFIEKFRKGYTNLLAGGDVNAMLEAPKPSTNRSKSPAGTAQRTAQQRQAEAAAAKRAKELAALQAKQVKSQKALTDEQKKQNALKKAQGIFDLEQIQIIAALQGKLSKEDRTRLEAQLALLNGNEAVATSLTKQILLSQDATGNLYKLWQTLPDAKNPFAYLEDWLKAFQGKLNATQFPVPVSGISVGTGQGGSVIDNYKASIPQSNVVPMPSTADIARLAKPMSSGSSTIGDYLNVVLQIDGKTIATALQDQSLSGNNTAVRRTGGW